MLSVCVCVCVFWKEQGCHGQIYILESSLWMMELLLLLVSHFSRVRLCATP